jgi:hypothetical protein
MNIEGVKNDSKATPLHQLPPPILSTNQEQPRLDGSSAVLDYNDILKEMDAPKKNPPMDLDEYYEPDEILEEPHDIDQERLYQYRPHRITQPDHRYKKRRPSALKKNVSCDENIPLWSKYKYGIFIVALVAAALYFLTPRLGVWLPRTMTEGKLNVLGIVIVAMAVGVSFEAGDRFVLSKY